MKEYAHTVVITFTCMDCITELEGGKNRRLQASHSPQSLINMWNW